MKVTMILYGMSLLAALCLGLLLAGVLSASARGNRAEQAYWRHAGLMHGDAHGTPRIPRITDDGHPPEAPV